MEELVLIDPDVALLVDFAEGIEVELSDQGLESVVTEELRQRFCLETLDV
jgi:hypothetical protein